MWVFVVRLWTCVFVENACCNVAGLNTFLAVPAGRHGLSVRLRRPSRVPVAPVCPWDRLETLCEAFIDAKIQILVDHNRFLKRLRNGRPTLRTGLPPASVARIWSWRCGMPGGSAYNARGHDAD